MSVSDGVKDIRNLLQAKKNIAATQRLHREDLQTLRESSAVVSTKDFLDTAMLITYTSYAPKGYVVGMPLIKAHPPAPMPEQMRSGELEAYHLQAKLPQPSSTDAQAALTLVQALWGDLRAHRLKGAQGGTRGRDASSSSSVGERGGAMEEEEEEVQGSQGAGAAKQAEGDVGAEGTEGGEGAEGEGGAPKRSRQVDIDFGGFDSEDSEE
ncbi:hypothetical protein B484DRAFT_452230 [Ochromonadaceae sp. CCMP2298]|nr:hypothetical protein B484DRAFT_452230 [Ochromonadaceae sp. CCMP2298]